ncbi:MAG: deoxyribodipyrimidine photolyase [Thiomonas sp. 20-64-9]|nr:MAG: deoxyribodipyrimidine photolyase [Thiomonas sp. 20-64-9]
MSLAERDLFEPTPEAAQARLDAVRPADYACSRNHLQGSVTRLSPYLTHGFFSLRQVVDQIQSRHGLGLEHKLLQELGWRAFFQHTWRHDGAAIAHSARAGPLPDAAYAPAVPGDLREARTGLPVIDQAVRTLYATGYLHNHARLWLASYAVHLRKVHWRAGADWMVAHLLDGDLGSNHLSWQWVAGTASSKPYLFNAENVAKFAPAAWHSPGTVIDTGYDRLATLAHLQHDCGPEPFPPVAVEEPGLMAAPPAGVFSGHQAQSLAGRDVWLIHPWALGDAPAGLLPVAVCAAEWSARQPWSARRWRFVATRMQALTPLRWYGAQADVLRALQAARSVQGWRNPHLGAAWEVLPLAEPPAPWPEPEARCRSFSAYWAWVRERASRVPNDFPRSQGELFHD